MTASAGNHGWAMAHAAAAAGRPLTVYISKDAPRTKVDAIQKAGAELAAVQRLRRSGTAARENMAASAIRCLHFAVRASRRHRRCWDRCSRDRRGRAVDRTHRRCSRRRRADQRDRSRGTGRCSRRRRNRRLDAIHGQSAAGRVVPIARRQHGRRRPDRQSRSGHAYFRHRPRSASIGSSSWVKKKRCDAMRNAFLRERLVVEGRRRGACSRSPRRLAAEAVASRGESLWTDGRTAVSRVRAANVEHVRLWGQILNLPLLS